MAETIAISESSVMLYCAMFIKTKLHQLRVPSDRENQGNLNIIPVMRKSGNLRKG